MLKEWFDYVFKENDAYTFATALLVLSAITKGLKPDNDKLPPVLNKGVLADCVSEIDKNTNADSKYKFDLNKMYETKLRALYLEDTKIQGGDTGWVVIPSKTNDPKNFESNVEKLKSLSHKNWCTKSFNAVPYLKNGDFHVYFENGQPKLGVRFVGNEIQEIQGELNNGKIPLSHFEEMQKHISENNLQLTQDATEEIKNAEHANKEVQKIKKDLNVAIENNDVKKIFEYFGIKVKEDENGYLTISEYKQPSELFTFKDLGIDENALLEKVKGIEGNADFRYSQVTSLGNLESIGGNANFCNSQVTNLDNLKSIGGNANFCNSQVTNLESLESIGGDADFCDSQVTNLGNLESIGGNADFCGSQVTNLDNLKSIGRYADFRYSQVTNLGNLKSIGGDADFVLSQVTNLDNLESIGENAYFGRSQVINLDNLKSIGGNADFSDSQVTNLGNLKSIGGDANFRYSQVTNLDNLKSIGGNADFSCSQVTNLDNLESIGGNANFWRLQVTNLDNLKSIGGAAYIHRSQEEFLGDVLRKIDARVSYC